MAAAAMAALGASQAPGLLPVAHAEARHATTVSPPPGPQIDGGSPYITAIPPLATPAVPAVPTPGVTPGGPVIGVAAGGQGLPATVLDAYQRAEAALAQSDPGCHLPWQLLAAIGQVESGQARGGAVDANGTTYRPILGPVLNGNGFANISDTDNGAYDGDSLHDRAVGPMQFIPSTWQTWGADGNGDGVRNPNNVYDAALAAGRYLCADQRDLSVPHDMDRAILGYNHSQAYLNLVKSWYRHFRQGGAVSVPDRSGTPVAPGQPSPSAPRPTTSPSPTPPGTPSPSATPTGPGKPTGPTGTPTPSHTTSPTATPTGSPSGTPTGTPTPTDSPTDTPTTPGCPTGTPTPTPTDSETPTPTATPTPTPTGTPDPCDTPLATPTPTPTGSGAATGPAVSNSEQAAAS